MTVIEDPYFDQRKTVEDVTVVYDHPEQGYPWDQERARKHLTLGGQYTATRIVVERYSTWVELREVPGEKFAESLFTYPAGLLKGFLPYLESEGDSPAE